MNPRLEGVAIRGIPVRMMDELQEFLQNNEIEIAALTIPKNRKAKRSCRVISGQMESRLFWNFAHTDLNLPESVIVENVHLSESLMRLSYNICRYKEEHN